MMNECKRDKESGGHGNKDCEEHVSSTKKNKSWNEVIRGRVEINNTYAFVALGECPLFEGRAKTLDQSGRSKCAVLCTGFGNVNTRPRPKELLDKRHNRAEKKSTPNYFVNTAKISMFCAVIAVALIATLRDDRTAVQLKSRGK
uniref:Uncharacterized protein n=1 Tax=Timema bartmani TaxID=61472 RepID=A0A7R9I9U8_9NEOP|nr:unnamed protein product [Timema bartmani]